MELCILLSIAAIYMALVGLGFIFAPQAIGIGAVPTDASAALMAYLRLFGSPFLGIAVLNWRRGTGAVDGAARHHPRQHGRIWCYSRLGCVGIVQWRAAVDKGVRYRSSAFRRCLYLGRAHEHVSQNKFGCTSGGGVHEDHCRDYCRRVDRGGLARVDDTRRHQTHALRGAVKVFLRLFQDACVRLWSSAEPRCVERIERDGLIVRRAILPTPKEDAEPLER